MKIGFESCPAFINRLIGLSLKLNLSLIAVKYFHSKVNGVNGHSLKKSITCMENTKIKTISERLGKGFS